MARDGQKRRVFRTQISQAEVVQRLLVPVNDTAFNNQTRHIKSIQIPILKSAIYSFVTTNSDRKDFSNIVDGCRVFIDKYKYSDKSKSDNECFSADVLIDKEKFYLFVHVYSDKIIIDTIYKYLDESYASNTDVDWIILSYDDNLKTDQGENAPSAAFKLQNFKHPSIPEGGTVKPYPGKRAAGDVRKFLISAYPHREDAEPLSLKWLEANDPKALRALYTQSTPETGSPSAFLRASKDEGDDLLLRHGLDLSTDEGVEKAKRLYGLLNGRLYGRKPN